ncbi:Uncharacterised protein [Candidatus Gugararchaeum adminiculabundum]|nr:Uncharacterised protein [Candidatus Gugararchaeum adminiculabundum]
MSSDPMKFGLAAKCMVLSFFVFSSFLIFGCCSISKASGEVCPRLGDIEDREACWTGFAIAAKDAVGCLKIETQQTKVGCFTGVAAVKKNSTVCTDYLDGAESDSCVIGAATTAKNEAMCAGAEDLAVRSACPSMVEASINGDEKACLKIERVDLKTACVKGILEAKKAKDSAFNFG